MRALFCFQVKRDPFRFGRALSGKTFDVVLFVVFSRYKDLSRSLFFNCLLHFFFTFFNDFLRFFSCCKNLWPSFLLLRWLAYSLISVDHCRSPCVDFWMRHFASKVFFFEIIWLHFLFSSFFDLFVLIYGWNQWYKQILSFVGLYFVIDAAI